MEPGWTRAQWKIGRIPDVRAGYTYAPQNIFNMYESGLFYRTTTKRTLSVRENSAQEGTREREESAGDVQEQQDGVDFHFLWEAGRTILLAFWSSPRNLRGIVDGQLATLSKHSKTTFCLSSWKHCPMTAEILDGQFRLAELEAAVKGMENGKSPGSDDRPVTVRGYRHQRDETKHQIRWCVYFKDQSSLSHGRDGNASYRSVKGIIEQHLMMPEDRDLLEGDESEVGFRYELDGLCGVQAKKTMKRRSAAVSAKFSSLSISQIDYLPPKGHPHGLLLPALNWEGKEVRLGQLVAVTYSHPRRFFVGQVVQVGEEQTDEGVEDFFGGLSNNIELDFQAAVRARKPQTSGTDEENDVDRLNAAALDKKVRQSLNGIAVQLEEARGDTERLRVKLQEKDQRILALEARPDDNINVDEPPRKKTRQSMYDPKFPCSTLAPSTIRGKKADLRKKYLKESFKKLPDNVMRVDVSLYHTGPQGPLDRNVDRPPAYRPVTGRGYRHQPDETKHQIRWCVYFKDQSSLSHVWWHELHIKFVKIIPPLGWLQEEKRAQNNFIPYHDLASHSIAKSCLGKDGNASYRSVKGIIEQHLMMPEDRDLL
ncbi:Hypp6787 [Branchiostoma lanceolatum]|uniref:Hypp6787 protein n=1 Tax=Branchiostoma lanceolatum TaxID=7740 RepID=A0A8J9YVJ4_BRALA|nr:Hypp6787 [Branchiostoma lanceolatum]